nr:MAG TPA: hypothetical protein [Caudoviricetes sp.]
MPKVKFSTDIQSISGKLCSKEGVVYSVNKQTGETYRSDRHSYRDANTEQQQQTRSIFKKKAQFAASWWKQNRPSDGKAGTAAYAAVMKAYRAQHKIGNPYSFMRSLVNDDLKVVLHGEDITGDVKPGGSTASGGTSASGDSGSQGGNTGTEGGNTDVDGSTEG